MDFTNVAEPIRDPIVNLRPEEEVQASGGTQENVPDVDGVVHSLTAGADFPSKVVNHRLGKTPKGMIAFWKDGFCDLYFDPLTATNEVMTIYRSVDVNVKVLVY